MENIRAFRSGRINAFLALFLELVLLVLLGLVLSLPVVGPSIGLVSEHDTQPVINTGTLYT